MRVSTLACDPENDMAAISSALPPFPPPASFDGLGIVGVRGVPNVAEKRHALLPLAYKCGAAFPTSPSQAEPQPHATRSLLPLQAGESSRGGPAPI